MQKCNKCKEERPFEQYRKRIDGSCKKICKVCDAEYDKIRWKNKRDRLLKQNKEYREKNKDILSEKRRKRLGQKKRTGVDREKLKESHRRNHKKYISRYQYKIKAHVYVREALRKGILIKPKKCTYCGDEKRLEGHHEDYDKQFEVIWLCKRCHLQLHRRRVNESMEFIGN